MADRGGIEMSTRWSMYVVPDEWTLKDCIVIGYMHRCMFMLNDNEFKSYMNKERKSWCKLYDEIVKQPAIHDYTSDDGGDPDHNKIMKVVPPVGRLYDFPKSAYKMIPELKAFAEEHKGKRYMCLN
jgi:hypothetical protein